LKLNTLRLGSCVLIITRTKPVMEYGCASSYLSIGLLSYKFLKDTESPFLVAPIVSFELKNNYIVKNLTQSPEHFLNIIA
jgi:hypothetical protein